MVFSVTWQQVETKAKAIIESHNNLDEKEIVMTEEPSGLQLIEDLLNYSKTIDDIMLLYIKNMAYWYLLLDLSIKDEIYEDSGLIRDVIKIFIEDTTRILINKGATNKELANIFRVNEDFKKIFAI